jgi:pyruvate dehydrogenase E1 component beta subunit
VVVPSTPAEAKGLLIASIRSEDPVIFLEPSRLYRSEKQDVPEDLYEIPLRRARVAKEGRDLTLIVWGAMVPIALKASEQAEAAGISVEVIDLRTLAPLDEEAVLASVGKTGRALIVHEAPRNCGLGAELAALLAEKAMLSLKAPIVRVTGQDITVPLPKSEDLYYIGPERVAKGIQRLMEF